MVVSVEFFGTQRALTKASNLEVFLSDQGRVVDVFRYLKDCYPNLPLRENDVWVTVNNNASNMAQVLNHDDRISFLPHVGGG